MDDIKELRDAFTADDTEWAQHREAREQDMKALGPDSTWDDKERKAREAEGRPCLSFDELSQHVNQLVNDAREQDRGVSVSPGPEDQDDSESRFVQALIREIETKSNAQLAYTRMFEDAASGGYGFLQIRPVYARDRFDEGQPIGPDAFDQELRIVPVHNPDLVTPGYFTLPNFADAERFWIDERVTHAEYKRRWPESELTPSDVIKEAGVRWATDKAVWVRERWQKETTRRRLALMPNPDPANPEPVGVWVDTIPKGERRDVLKAALAERWVDVPKITHAITNGVEYLEEPSEQPGIYLPIVGCTGKILWEGDTRYLMSLIRKAHDPQQVHNYSKTTEAELAAMTPKFPWFYYAGALDKENAKKLANANRKPVGGIAIEPTFDKWNPAWGPVPYPTRNPYDPPIQAFEMLAESTRRSIQSSMGTGFLPTEAQRLNQKSGVALREIASSASKGAYHFVDHYEHAIRHVGDVLVDRIPYYYDTPRNLHVRGKDNEPIKVRINDPQAPAPADLGGKPIMLKKGAKLTVTVSTGPSYATEQEKASEFADNFVTARPDQFALYADLIFKLKQLGPLGDKMAERAHAMLPPPILALENGQKPNPQAQQMQMQLQQMQQQVQQLLRIIETEQIKTEGALKLKQLDGDIRLALAEMQGQQKLQQQAATVAADIDTREDEQAHEMAMAGADAAKAERDAVRANQQANTATMLGRKPSA